MNNVQQELIKIAEYSLQNYSATGKTFFELMSFCHHLDAENLELTDIIEISKKKHEWGITELYNTPYIKINLYTVPKGKTVPVHDHPGQQAVLKVLWGKIFLESYDWAEEHPFSGLARCTYKHVLNGSSQPMYTLPKTRNLHSIKASEHAAFLDICLKINPTEERDCTFYRHKNDVCIKNETLKEFVPRDEINEW